MPPAEWQAHSKQVEEECTLSVEMQIAEKNLGDAFNLIEEQSGLTYGAFKEVAMQKQNELCVSEMPIDVIEELHWHNMRQYSTNNRMSLFGDIKIWNLDRMTKSESNIHATQTHHNLNVIIS